MCAHIQTNSGHHVWWQACLPSELSCWAPIIFLNKFYYVYLRFMKWCHMINSEMVIVKKTKITFYLLKLHLFVLHVYTHLCFESMHVCVCPRYSANMEVRGKHARVSFLLTFKFWGLKSGSSGLVTSIFTSWATLLTLTWSLFSLLKNS